VKSKTSENGSKFTEDFRTAKTNDKLLEGLNAKEGRRVFILGSENSPTEFGRFSEEEM